MALFRFGKREWRLAMEYLGGITILLLILAAYWALVVFPKQRSFQSHQRYIRQLQVGDRIVTYGGLVGTISELNPDSGLAKVRLADNLEVLIITAAIMQPFNPEELAKSAQTGLTGGQAESAEG